ncbi:MAG: NADH-quinone oxidoreductase subunit N [Ardenticatenaceae bacterium]|nr:NADH-quinone oxidoreductase subunit N [Ardenticatenaceae bacterium]HBY98552.1 NADH-quinone oxidoreductase subunit N [Chloroflexota bacterium]
MPTIEIGSIQWPAIAQATIIVVTAMVVLLTDLFLPDQENDAALASNALDRLGARLIPNEKDWLAWLSLAGIVGATILGIRQWPLVVGGANRQPIFGFSNMVVVDFFTLEMNFVFLVVAAIVVLMAPRYLAARAIARGEFYALILFATSGLMLMASGLDLIIIFLGLEVLSIPLYILASFLRPHLDSEESGLKYFLLGAFATGFLLYGIALTYGATGTTNLSEMRQVMLSQSQGGTQLSQNLMLIAGLGLLLVGLGFKIAMAPFHQWTPDVYEGSPTPVTAFMVAGTKAGGFAALIRVLLIGFAVAAPLWMPLIAGLSVITMTIGNVGALLQRNVKRMLAYSSIAHAGYILIAVAAQSVGSAVLYLAIYALMNLGAFACIIAFSQGSTRERVNIEDYAGLAARRPFLAAALSLFLLSLAGFPPLAGFFAKFAVFTAGVQAGLTWLVVVGVLNSVVSVFYYARIIVQMYMREPDVEPVGQLSLLTGVGLTLALIGVLVLGLFPTPILNLM